MLQCLLQNPSERDKHPPSDVLDSPANSPQFWRVWRILRDKSGKADVLPDFRVKHRPEEATCIFSWSSFQINKTAAGSVSPWKFRLLVWCLRYELNTLWAISTFCYIRTL